MGLLPKRLEGELALKRPARPLFLFVPLKSIRVLADEVGMRQSDRNRFAAMQRVLTRGMRSDRALRVTYRLWRRYCSTRPCHSLMIEMRI